VGITTICRRLTCRARLAAYATTSDDSVPTVSTHTPTPAGRALRLSDVERAHLGNLVRPADSGWGPDLVRPSVQRLIDLMDSVPAVVLGIRLDVLAFNRLADAVCGFSERPEFGRNMPARSS
jgi:MmyB-like transcription regulator ligand binding domain